MPALLQDILLNDRGFAFDPAGGETFQLSATGLRVVRLLQQGCDDEAVLKHLVEEYEVDDHTARRDLESFLGALEQLGWKS
ncbi:MAG: HPr-rel-A system PqqD family peptide chaperone [Verrucomicrobiaceae bacterium]